MITEMGIITVVLYQRFSFSYHRKLHNRLDPIETKNVPRLNNKIPRKELYLCDKSILEKH